MNIFEAIAACFRKYGVFSGRAGRREFWYFTLFCAVVPAVFSLIFGSDSVISLIVTAGLLVPSFSVSWRRMHDIGKAGAWSLIAFIPVVGFIIGIVWCARDSEPGNNIYGPNPNVVGSDELR